MTAIKRYKLIISAKARDVLGEVVAFIALNSSDNAKMVKKEIIEGIKSLEVFPERAPFLIGEFIPYNKYHKLVVLKRFLLIYQIRDEKVYIDFIVDCKQDYKWLLPR